MLLDIQKLIAKYKLDIKGVIHVGGHTGEEYETYTKLGIRNNVFYEPQTLPYNIFKETYPHANVIKKAMGSRCGKATMYTETSNKGASSSLLKPALHVSQYPHIQFTSKEEVEVGTLDDENLHLDNFNFLNMDVQGFELEVLKGATKTLEKIDYIMTEINKAELYEKNAFVEDIDDFLKTYGFQRVETDWAGETWGDGFYIKKKKICLINQPAGLGDILFTQKIAKKAIAQGYEVVWPVISEFLDISKYISGIKFCDVDSDFENKHFFKYHQVIHEPNSFMYIPLWHAQGAFTMKAKYDMVGLKYEDWTDYFTFTRNREKEDELYYNVLGLKDDSVYNFISNKYGSPSSNTVTIDLPNEKELQSVCISYMPEFTLFDWCKVIENATELNVISSSISYLIEKLILKAQVFNHYTRPNIRKEDGWMGMDYLKTDCNKLSL